MNTGPPPPTVTISANPAQISSGQSSTLTVTAQNASQVTVTNNVDNTTITMASTGGTVSVSPAQTTTYKATATASNGSTANASTTVTVTTSGNLIRSGRLTARSVAVDQQLARAFAEDLKTEVKVWVNADPESKAAMEAAQKAKTEEATAAG